MIAIRTRYKGATDRRGSRCIADDMRGNKIILTWDDALDHDRMHRKAAEALRDKMGWRGELIQGNFPTFDVFVFEDKPSR